MTFFEGMLVLGAGWLLGSLGMFGWTHSEDHDRHVVVARKWREAYEKEHEELMRLLLVAEHHDTEHVHMDQDPHYNVYRRESAVSPK